MNKLLNYVTPRTQRNSIARKPVQEVSVLQKDLKLYGSGIWVLLYLVT